MTQGQATAAELFREVVDVVFGGVGSRAARVLGVSDSLVSLIASGKRRVTPDLAARIEQATGGRYRKERFVWPNDTHGRRQRKAA